ncbi:MAG: glycosyltransferase [Bacteroidia bacterium]|nr:glycosyltransferase [Bacteroidia bacterium]
MLKLSVIIVNYNVQHFLEQALHSVTKALKGITGEIWVVDNNSVDGSVDMVKEKFPDVKLIENKRNSGFSAANNQAIKKAAGEYVLLLNPDTVVEEESFAKMIAFMDNHPDAGALGVKMMNGKGEFLPESKRALPTPSVAFYKIFGLSALFPRSRRFGRYHLAYLPADAVNEVDILSGACMLIRKAVLDKTGLLDESFFMYGEDIDLSYRITQAGYKNYYFPETRIIHYKGESTKKRSANYVLVFYNAMRIFAQKHYSGRNAKLFAAFINFAIFIRASIALLHRLIDRIWLPATDFLVIYAGYYFISLSYGNIRFAQAGYYSKGMLLLLLPSYILIWLLSIWLSGGYDRPVKTWKAVRGVLWGAAIVLILYALLPESYRFSRALVLLGAAWALLALVLVRQICRLLKIEGFKTDSTRILIIGKEEECRRVHELLNKSGIKTETVKYLNPGESADSPFESRVEGWSETMLIYQINQVIFCAKDLPLQLIMDAMSSIPQPELEFKIAPPESWAVIGSNSVNAPGELYVIDVHAINTAPNLRAKRISDILLSKLFFLFSPFLIWFQRNPAGYFANIFSVATGKKSWVGYCPAGSAARDAKSAESSAASPRLPRIKRGVLSPLDAIPVEDAEKHDAGSLNAIYARDYRVSTDMKIIWKGLRQLGRR